MARSTRGGIGEQWWSRRFVEVLESFALGSRLTRGRNYARRGQVISLQISPGEVAARVQGSRPAPYRVTIGLDPFTELVWAKVEVVLTEQAIHSARLLAGELPPDLEAVFAAAGAPLFPLRPTDLRMSCSCPDHEVPCKHLAAAIYLLAESFDDDPFRILHWRGRDREALLVRLRQLRDGTPSPGTASTAAGPAVPAAAAERQTVGAAMALDDDSRPVVDPGDPFAFWSGRELPALPTHPPLPPDLLLRQLPVPGAVLGGADLTVFLRPLYARLAEADEAPERRTPPSP